MASMSHSNGNINLGDDDIIIPNQLVNVITVPMAEHKGMKR